MLSTLSRLRRPAGALLTAALLAFPALRADVAGPGYQLVSQSHPLPYSVTCSLPGGDYVTFNGQSVDRWSATGAFIGNLGTLPGLTFASFVLATPDGSAVVLGENANGDLFVAQTDGSGLAALVNLPFNYDAAWLPDGDLVVSAAVGGLGAGNDLFRVSLTPPSAAHLGHLPGASGPVAVSPTGELYYATASDQFPPPPGSTTVLAWPAPAVLAGGLSVANATTVAAGFEGGSSMVVDPVTGRIYLAETNFALTFYRIVQVNVDAAHSPLVVGQGLDYISDLEILPGGGPGSFDPYQPDDARLLRYNSPLGLFTVRPRRPLLTISGPGTTGPGPITFNVSGAIPGGTMVATACPQALLHPSASAHLLATFLWVTRFELAQTRRGSTLQPLDVLGNGKFVLSNPGNLQGIYAWQFLVGDASGVQLGSTTMAQF